MKENTLIFVPYQDSDNFYEDGILTREFAMLYMLEKEGLNNVINVKKPRTSLDKKRYIVNESFYPNGTIEREIKDICDGAFTIQYSPYFSTQQLLKRRMWWLEGYKKTANLFPSERVKGKTVVYSDNPFAEPLLEYLKKQKTYYLYFDVMDNFAIHPSLNKTEQKAALEGYCRIMTYADSVSANSEQTCRFIQEKTGRKIALVKNGVFVENEVKEQITIEGIKEIYDKKCYFKKCAGYIGKMGLRLDAELINDVTQKCSDVLFVFVGPFLKGQLNPQLQRIIDSRENVIHINRIPSAYVYSMLDVFDILMIPHSVGKGENGGDPLKLYQYLTRSKPIITTSILGVSEFSTLIKITNIAEEWVDYLNADNYELHKVDLKPISWENRMLPIIQEIKQWLK